MILDVCAKDDFIRPVIIAGMCTAMRRGDCCLLKCQVFDGSEARRNGLVDALGDLAYAKAVARRLTRKRQRSR